MRPHVRSLSLVVALCIVQCALAVGQEIVLRDLTRIRNVEIKSLEDDGVRLTDGQTLTWDRILVARVGDSFQAKLDRELKQQGLSLFRLKHRIQTGNRDGAFEIANHWYQNENQRFGGAEANFLVCRSVMLGRIRRQESEHAVEPMIRALRLQEDCSQEFLDQFPDFIFRDSELKTEICEGFVPVFGKVASVQQALNQLEDTFDLDALTRRYPALAVYLCAMAIHVQQRERAEGWNTAMGSVQQLRPWQRILGSTMSRVPLSRLLDGTEGSLRVAAMYWWATADGQMASKQQRLLTLLKIVAAYSQQFPSLAQRSAFAAAELCDDPTLVQMLTGQRSAISR